MAENRRNPIGIELVRRGIVTQNDIERALEYQRENHRQKNRRYTKYIKYWRQKCFNRNNRRYFRRKRNYIKICRYYH